MNVIYNPNLAAYQLTEGGVIKTLDGQLYWATRRELKETLEDHGYELGPDMRIKELA